MKKYRGCYTALITPFKKDLSLDLDAFKKLLEMQIQGGVSGVVIAGTTGEASTMTSEEKLLLWRTAKNIINGRIQLIAGTGSNETVEAIKETKMAQDVGVDGVLVVTPYYNRPNQDGLYRHYKMLHDVTNIEIILYNVPGRTGVDLDDSTTSKLAQDCPRIVGLKDATGNLARLTSLMLQVDRRDFCFLTGEDTSNLAFVASGGDGIISVTSNIKPAKVQELHKKVFENQLKDALEIQKSLFPLSRDLFCTTNPIPVKYAVSELGMCENVLRPPLFALENADMIRNIQKSLKI